MIHITPCLQELLPFERQGLILHKCPLLIKICHFGLYENLQILQQRGHPCPIDTFLVLSITVEYNIRMARVTVYIFPFAHQNMSFLALLEYANFATAVGVP